MNSRAAPRLASQAQGSRSEHASRPLGLATGTNVLAESAPRVNGVRRHPLLEAWIETLSAPLPTVAELESLRATAVAIDEVTRPSIRAQNDTLLADGLHYEVRIAESGVLATRADNAHDVFNALVWLRHTELKHALNARQVADIARVGAKQRTRGQCALTHFDEAGAIVWLADPALLEAWDAHDWPQLFVRECGAWGSRIAVSVFGHALVEHVWNGHDLPVAKALVVGVDADELARQTMLDGAIVQRWPQMERQLADAIRAPSILTDPQELRPLPLAGIAGWHAQAAREDFCATAPCFRPLRTGRRYPPPWRADSRAT